MEQQTKDQAVTVYERQQNVPAPIKSLEDIERVGKWITRSGMTGAGSDEQGIIVAMTCAAQNITPIDFIRTYHIIENRPAKRADAMLAEFLARGGKHKIVEFSAKRAAGIFTKGENTLTLEVTMAQADAAEWTKDSKGNVKKNWRCTPDAMLWARLVSKAVRVLDPGVNAGTYTPEEIADLDGARDITSEVRVTAASPSSTVPTAAGDMPVGGAARAPASEQPKPEFVTPEVMPPETKEGAAPKRGRPAKAAAQATQPADAAAAAPAASPSPAVTPAAAEPVDFSAVPFGKQKGAKFSTLTDKALAMLADPAAFAAYMTSRQAADAEKASMTDAHRAEVVKVIEARKAIATSQEGAAQ